MRYRRLGEVFAKGVPTGIIHLLVGFRNISPVDVVTSLYGIIRSMPEMNVEWTRTTVRSGESRAIGLVRCPTRSSSTNMAYGLDTFERDPKILTARFYSRWECWMAL